MRQGTKLLLLVALLGLSLACGQTADTNSGSDATAVNGGNPDTVDSPPSLSPLCPDLGLLLPAEWQHVDPPIALDANGDGVKECVVLYHFDIPPGADEEAGPIGGVVYQPDDKRPPCVVPYDLTPQGGGHLCEHSCDAVTRDILSGYEGKELLVRDVWDGETVRLSIFRWNSEKDEYEPLGHFSADRVTIARDEVEVFRREPDRAQLAMRYTYHPRDKRTYYRQDCDDCTGVNARTPVTFVEHRLVFWPREPEDATLSPYPERAVLAFYKHYTDVGQASEYFTDDSWERLGQCAGNQCGCTLPRDEVDYVRVTDLVVMDEGCDPAPVHECEDCCPNQATVVASVICEPQDCTEVCEETALCWDLVREDNHWKLDNARPCPGASGGG